MYSFHKRSNFETFIQSQLTDRRWHQVSCYMDFESSRHFDLLAKGTHSFVLFNMKNNNGQSFNKHYQTTIKQHKVTKQHQNVSRTMKVFFAAILAATATCSVQGSTSSSTSSETTSSLRALQNYYQNNNNNYGGYQNYEQALKSQISAKSFSFTGCGTTTNTYGYNVVYATFRLCDSCHTATQYGCGNGNGDYIISMREFGESFGEYWEQTTYRSKETAPFRCVKAEEYRKAYYESQMYGGNNGQYQGQQQQQQYNYNNGQQQEYYVGPVCNGGTQIHLGLFWDESCAQPVEKWSLHDVLGFDPNNQHGMTSPPQCVSCAYMQDNYYNGGGNGEVQLNPLCDRMVQEAGRCDRNTRTDTDFDIVWQRGHANNQNQNNRNNNNNYSYDKAQNCPSVDNYMTCQNRNTCALIDSLHTTNRGLGPTGIVAIILSAMVVGTALLYFFGKDGRLGLKGVRLTPKKQVQEESSVTDYQREEDM